MKEIAKHNVKSFDIRVFQDHMEINGQALVYDTLHTGELTNFITTIILQAYEKGYNDKALEINDSFNDFLSKIQHKEK